MIDRLFWVSVAIYKSCITIPGGIYIADKEVCHYDKITSPFVYKEMQACDDMAKRVFERISKENTSENKIVSISCFPKVISEEEKIITLPKPNNGK